MKVFKLLMLVVLMSVAFVSCEKDEESAASVSGNKYETTYIKMDMSGTITGSFELKTKAEIEEYGMYFVIEFKSNGDLYSEEGKVGTWTQSGSTVTMVTEDADGSASTNLTVQGDVLIMSESETEDGNTTNVTMHLTKM